MKECDKVKRKTRIIKIWVPRENNFVCGECGARGDCGENEAYAMENNLPFYWDDGEDCIMCRNAHKLTTKEELEKQIPVKEIQQYGFWLRFVSEHFIPCDKCQDKLHEKLMNSQVAFYNNLYITLEKLKKGWQFILGFVQCGSLSKGEDWIPCDKCQKELQEIWEDKELHIGNDVKPMVELWRKWEIVDEKE